MKTLKLTHNYGVLNVQLHRPDKRNAFEPQMIGELTKVFTEASTDTKVRAILLDGAGETFCAGGDLEWMKSMANFSQSENLKDAEALFDMFNAQRTCLQPIIGKIHGHAFGGGLGLVALCDMAAAETKTAFCFSEVKWGLVPSVISPFVREKMNHSLAREWMLTAKIFSAEEAKLAQLVQFTGTLAQVEEYVEKSIKLLMSAAPSAVRETKKLLLSQSTVDWSRVRRLTTEVIAERRVSADGQKGLTAFLEKKNPDWSEFPYGTAPKA